MPSTRSASTNALASARAASDDGRLLVSVVVVNWNGGSTINRCLDALQRQRLDGFLEILVADNASTDDSRAILERYESTGAIRLLAMGENLGFAKANNLAARQAGGSILVFLNPDAFLTNDRTLEDWLVALRDPEVGLAGPMLLNPDGTIQQSPNSFPTVRRALFIGTGLHFLLPDRLRARLAPVAWSQRWSVDTDWLRGAALAMRRDLFERLEGFSEDTFMYGEDLDLGYKVRRAGYRVRYHTDAKVIHVDNVSADQRWTAPERAQKVAEGDLLFMRRHYARPRRLAVQLLWGLAFAGRAVVFRILGRDRPAGVYAIMAKRFLWRG